MANYLRFTLRAIAWRWFIYWLSMCATFMFGVFVIKVHDKQIC